MGFTLVSKSYQDIAATPRSGAGVSGNYLDTNTVTFQYDYTSRVNVSPTIPVQKVGDTFTLLSGDWGTLIGAFNGANLNYNLTTNGVPVINANITFVDGADMELDTVPNSLNDGLYEVGFFQVLDPLEQFDMIFNLAPNSSGGNPNSLIDGEEVRFSCVLNNALTVTGTDDFIQLGNKSGGSKFPVKTIELISDTAGVKRYEIILEFKYWVFLDLTPFQGSAAVGVFTSVTGFMVAGDPSITVNHTTFQQGGTGGENENFNGQPSNYTLDFINWTDDSANPMDACDHTQNSNFELEILGNFSAFADFNIKMFTIPDDPAEYSNLPNPVDNNVMLGINDTLIPQGLPVLITGNLNDAGAGYNIEDLTFIITTSVKVKVTGKVVPNAAFTSLFESRDINDRKYKVLVQCENDSLSKKLADTVNVLCDFQDMKENFIPLGKWSDMAALEMFDHNDDKYLTTPDAHLEDDVLTEALFTLPKDTVNQPWTGISLRVVAQKVSTGERFTLEEFFYDTSLIPTNTVTGIVPLSYSQNRGLKFPATSDKNDVIIELYPALDDPTNFGVRAAYPFIMKYQDWEDLPQAHNDFFGNKNNDWYNYSSNPNWQLQMEIGLQLSSGEYVNDYKFTIRTYNDWAEVAGSSFSFTQADGVTPITKPYADLVSKVVGTHEIDTEDWTGNEWALIHVRPEFGAPQWLIGSVLVHSDSANPLFPLAGETEGKLTVGTKIVTVEALFDPAKIDVSGNVTFTTRINGDTTGGIRSNIYKETYTLAQKPIRPQLRAQPEEEKRGGDFCCCPPFEVFADKTDGRDHRNSITAAWEVGDSVTFILKKNGVVTSYNPISVAAPQQPDGWTTQINWREVIISDDTGLYTLEVESVVAGQPEPVYTWGTYCLMTYDSVVNSELTYYNAEGKVRIRSEFNDYNMKQRFNFTDARLVDTIWFEGKFGYVDPNTLVENTEYTNAEMQKIRRMDMDSYELRTGLICINIVREIRMHVLGENRCWVSDHNRTSPEHYFNVDVIVKEGYKPEYFDGSKDQRGVIVFEDKVRDCRTYFQDPRQTAETVTPTDACEPIVISGVLTSVGWQTGQTAVYESGDDGDEQRGGGVDFFTLTDNNFFSNTDRFTDTLGTQVYANNIIIDWSTFNPLTGDVNWWYRIIDATQRNWVTCYSFAASLNIAGFTNWILPNEDEIMRIRNSNVVFWINYPPFNIAANYIYATTTTTPLNTLLFSAFLPASNTLNPRSKALVSYRVLAMRIGNISEL